jgi:hypothetical protein
MNIRTKLTSYVGAFQCMKILCAEIFLNFQALASKAGVKRPGEEAPQGQPGQSPVFQGLIYSSVLRHIDTVAFPVKKVF